MAQLSEREFSESGDALDNAQRFDVYDWLEAIMADGVDDHTETVRVRSTGWYNTTTQTRYRLRRVEVPVALLKLPRLCYYLQVYPEPDDNFKGYLYCRDTQQTFQYDSVGRTLNTKESSSHWTEAELLTHLYTTPFERWPHRNPLIVAACLAKLRPKEFDPPSRQNLPARLGDLLRRLWRGSPN